MRYGGDYTPGKTVRIAFNTNQANGTPITLAGTPAISIYKDSSTTESTSGVTLTVDFDGRTGSHLLAIDTTADATFYAAGSDFRAVLTAGTVDSITVVGVIVGRFSLSNRAAMTNRASASMILATVNASPSPTTTSCGAAVDVVPTVADQFKGRVVIFARDTTTTALRGQATGISASTAPGSGNTVLTFDALTTAPATGDLFVIV
jgi:hypothetical protein